MKYLCSVFVFVFAVSITDAKSPCCMPDQWESLAGGMIDSVNQGKLATVGYSIPKMSMDLKNNRIAVQEVIYTDPSFPNMTIIIDFNAGYMWTVHWHPGPARCVKQALPSGTKPQKCIPPDWMFVMTVGMGFGSNVVSTDNWVSPQPSSTFSSYLVTSDTCVPVTEYTRAGGNNPMVASNGFFNVTSGIKDPSVFKVPSICNQQPAESKEANPVAEYLFNRFSTTC